MLKSCFKFLIMLIYIRALKKPFLFFHFCVTNNKTFSEIEKWASKWIYYCLLDNSLGIVFFFSESEQTSEFFGIDKTRRCNQVGALCMISQWLIIYKIDNTKVHVRGAWYIYELKFNELISRVYRSVLNIEYEYSLWPSVHIWSMYS